jgi:3',5'-cyclic AMP phosphodiesterase CpdA
MRLGRIFPAELLTLATKMPPGDPRPPALTYQPDHPMNPPHLNRRRFLGVGAAATASLPLVSPAATAAAKGGTPVTVLHLTDTHIRPEHDAPARCRKILRAIRERHRDISFVINTGDSIFAADYGNITRERVEEQWKIWDEWVMPELKGLPILHVVGNHDVWHAGPEGDPMRGVPYVCKRLGIEKPYSSSRHAGWEMITLDNSSGSIDPAQREWLFKTLDALPAAAPVLLAAHCPILSLAGDYAGGNMSGGKAIVEKLRARQGPVLALSGHVHVQSSESLYNVHFHCNGALSGHWWEPGPANDGCYERTPMGYALVKLWPDGRSESRYFPVPAIK